MEWLWLKMLGSLLLIVALIVATLWILKRFMTFGKPASASGIAMEIAGVLHLAPRRSVYAVKTGGQVILLGVAEHGGVTFLTQMPESSFSSAGEGLQAGVQVQNAGLQAGFSPFLTMLVERFKTGTTPGFQTAQATVRETIVESEPASLNSEAMFSEPEPAVLPQTAPVKKKRSSAASRKKTSIQ